MGRIDLDITCLNCLKEIAILMTIIKYLMSVMIVAVKKKLLMTIVDLDLDLQFLTKLHLDQTSLGSKK